MSDINNLLIEALYTKYAPEKNINAQINFVQSNYDSQDKFVEDFYKEYGVELTPEKKLFISQNFGGFGVTAKPTINEKDFDVSISPESANFVSFGSLTEQEEKNIKNKFTTEDNEPYLGYLDRKVYKYQATGENIFEQGANMAETSLGQNMFYNNYEIIETDELQLTEDLNYTAEDRDTHLANEIKKFKNPTNPEYNLSEAEIQEINQIKKEVFAGVVAADLQNEELYKKAASIKLLNRYKDEYTSSIIQTKVDKYIRSRADLFGGYEQMSGFGIEDPDKPKYEEFDRLKDIVFNDVDKFKEVNENILKEYDKNQELGKEILAYQEKTSQDDFEFNADEAIEMQNKLALYNANQKVLTDAISKFRLNTKNLNVLINSADLLGKDYDLLKKNLARIGLGFGDLGLGGLRVLSAVSNVVPFQAAWAQERGEMLDNLSLKWDNYKRGKMNSYSPDIKFADAFKDGNFGAFVAQEISTQIPIFTTMIGGGGIAGFATKRLLGASAATRTVSLFRRKTPLLPIAEATGAGGTIAITSGGQQYNTMTAQEMRDPFLEFSEAEKFLVSAGYGASEGVFGTAPSYLLLRNTANLFLRSGKSAAFKLNMKQYIAQNIAFPMVAEPLSEGLTTVTQNMLLGRPVMENVDHAMFSGLMFSVMMNASPAIAGRLMQDFSSITKMKEFNKINSEMNGIDKALNRKNSKFKKGTAEYDSLINTYNQLQMDRDAIVNDLYNNITTKVSKRSFQQFMENTSAQSDIRARAEKIVKEGGMFLSAEDTNALNALQKEFDQYQFARDLFRSQENFGNEFANLKGKDSSLYDMYIKKAKQKLKADGINDPSSVKTFQEASSIYFADQFELYTKNVKKNDLVNMQVFETNQELLNYLDSDPARKAELDKKEKRWVVEDGKLVYKTDTRRNAILKGDINGINTTINGKKFELISKENSLNNERAGTGYHEFSHSVLFEALAAQPEQYLDIAVAIRDYVKETDKKLYNLMFKSAGGQQADIANPEEVIVNFLERVAEGKVKDPKFIGVVSESLSKTSGLDVNFRSEIDTIKFLHDLGLKIKNGTFKRSDLKSIRVNLRGKLNEANTEVRKMIDDSKYSDSDANIVQTLYNNLGAEAAPQIANNKYVRKVINEVLRKYSNVPGYATYKKTFEDGLINDPTYGILGSLLTYDANKNPVLVSHIIARLRQRSKTLAEDIFPQFFGDDSKDTGYDPTDPEILNQRESLRISLGLSEDVINRVKQSVLKTFGGKLPNVTSIKFRKKLQESFRIFLKKTIAKNVLKQGDEYKAFLENNFELIYSVLSQGNINKRFKPFAERVLDKETGKQLREKTAQGNDIFIKRKITKEEFVNYFVGEDVKPSTRGTRKTALAESLAEEIAFDATLDVLRDPTPIDKAGNTLLDRVEQIIEINGEEFSENYLAQVAKEIDRATDFKFSDSSAGITVLDFDDTVAISKSMVIVEMEDKTKKELTPAEFAKQHDALKKEGAKFDFSQFNKVIGGEKGPLFGRLQKAVNKFGNKNVFILTARPQEAAPAIKAWLKSQGIALSEKNIVGLSDGSPEAKANWILGKAQEGFNNFYFADDVLENTYAVEQVLSQVDVKYRVDQNFGPSQFSDSGKVEGLIEFIENAIDNEFTGDQLWKAMQENNPLMYSIITKAKKRGETEELFRAKQLKGLLGDRIEILNMNELENVLTSSRKKQDLQVLFKFKGGVTIGMEIKMNALAKMGSKNSYTELLENYGADTMSKIIDIQTDLNGAIFGILENEGLIEGEDYYFAPPPGKSETTDGYIEIRYDRKKLLEKTGFDRLARKPKAKRPKGGLLNAKGLQLSDTNKYEFNIPTLKPIVDLYTNKDAQYIIIGEKIYSLATNPLNLNVPSLLSLPYDSKLQITMKDENGTSGQGRMIIRGYLQIAEKGTTKNINPSEFNDIKGTKTIEEAFTNFSDSNVNLDNEINNIIEKSSTAQGKTVKNIVRYSDTKAKILGKNKGKGGFLFRFSADDLQGFTYEIIKGIRGAEGDKAKKFFQENLHRPYNAGIQALNFEQLKLMDDFKAIKDKVKSVPKRLKKVIEGDVYTNEQAIRIYMWKKQGMDIPGIPKQDVQDMVNHVKSDLNLLQFANDLIKINGADGYPAPNQNWEAGTIEMDLYDSINDTKRAKHLKEWQDNVNILFSKENLNKMEAVYGSDFVKNLTGMLERMRTGRNRTSTNPMITKWQDWINGSVGTIMFYNMRSAILQTISMANYINWHDNNMIAAGKAFANQKQYWKDWLYIFNSDYLRVRRGGLQLNVNENELAEAANKKGVRGVIALILRNGFTPTRIADSIAIATGGATMYRNRISTYLKDGLSQTEAEARAFEDFMEITEESQQSSRPDKISAQQASSAGRILLAFANTPMQYNRMIKRAGQDLYYGRGNWKTNVSKIVYYSSIQNFLFNALQKGVYALGFGLYEDDPDKQKEKTTSVFEGMADSLLRGVGIQGQVALTAKAFLKDIAKERRGFTEENWDNILELSPPLGSKIRKMMSADYMFKKYENSVQAQAMDVRNPYLMAYAQYASALFNIPLDRALRKIHNLQSAMADDTAEWQRAALFLGWNEWDIGIDGMERELGKTPIKTEEYIKEREETKEAHQRKIDSIVNLGYIRIPLSGPKSFKPEGKLGKDYLRLKRKIDGKYQYFVTEEVFNKRFPPPPPKTRKEIEAQVLERIRKKYNVKL